MNAFMGESIRNETGSQCGEWRMAVMCSYLRTLIRILIESSQISIPIFGLVLRPHLQRYCNTNEDK